LYQSGVYPPAWWLSNGHHKWQRWIEFCISSEIMHQALFTSILQASWRRDAHKLNLGLVLVCQIMVYILMHKCTI